MTVGRQSGSAAGERENMIRLPFKPSQIHRIAKLAVELGLAVYVAKQDPATLTCGRCSYAVPWCAIHAITRQERVKGG